MCDASFRTKQGFPRDPFYERQPVRIAIDPLTPAPENRGRLIYRKHTVNRRPRRCWLRSRSNQQSSHDLTLKRLQLRQQDGKLLAIKGVECRNRQ